MSNFTSYHSIITSHHKLTVSSCCVMLEGIFPSKVYPSKPRLWSFIWKAFTSTAFIQKCGTLYNCIGRVVVTFCEIGYGTVAVNLSSRYKLQQLFLDTCFLCTRRIGYRLINSITVSSCPEAYTVSSVTDIVTGNFDFIHI